MISKQVKRNLILGILFFLPVTFLLFLYPAKHNYNALDVVKPQVSELVNFSTKEGLPVNLENHLTVLSFFGSNPKSRLTEALNLKELVYDKFKGFKTFQIVVVLPNEAKHQLASLKQEIMKYEALEYWQFAFADGQSIQAFFDSLNANFKLDDNLSSSNVFIIDKELNQRGRLDDRTDKEIEKQAAIYPLYSYNCIEVAELKNKMSEDMRVLFTEYRQKRKGNFDSNTRRANDLKTHHEQ
ncbi:hypothetical protein [Corallibacter sp.]|uniref:hypothetical protein n=1 Tax=Corallibacter sp. TaxID=2038084 RepID=UPI003AB85380